MSSAGAAEAMLEVVRRYLGDDARERLMGGVVDEDAVEDTVHHGNLQLVLQSPASCLVQLMPPPRRLQEAGFGVGDALAMVQRLVHLVDELPESVDEMSPEEWRLGRV